MLYLITCIALRNSKHLRFTMNKSACRNESSTQLSWRCSTKEKLKISENKELVISVDVGEQPMTVHREVERADNILPNKKQLDKAERKSAFVLYYSKEQNCVCSAWKIAGCELTCISTIYCIRPTSRREAAPRLCANLFPIQAQNLTFSQHKINHVVNKFLIIHWSFMIKQFAYILRIVPGGLFVVFLSFCSCLWHNRYTPNLI